MARIIPLWEHGLVKQDRNSLLADSAFQECLASFGRNTVFIAHQYRRGYTEADEVGGIWTLAFVPKSNWALSMNYSDI